MGAGVAAASALVLIYLGVLAQAAMRQTLPLDALLATGVLLVLSLVVAITALQRGIPRAAVVDMATDAVCVLVIVSTALHLSGVKPSAVIGTTTGATSLFGGYRTAFPLTFGLTSHALLSGIAVLAGAIDLRGKRRPAFALLSIACGLWGILAVDGRAALLFCLLLLAISVMGSMPLKLRFALPFLFILFAPLFMATVQVLPDAVLEPISRSGRAEEIRSGNQRSIIWGFALQHLARLDPQILLGYGANGHVPSEVSRGYAYLFYNWRSGDPTSYSLHNAGLQAIFDGGVLLVAALAFILWRILRAGALNVGGAWRKAFWVSAFLVLAGGTEAVFGYRYRDVLYVIVLLGSAAVTLPAAHFVSSGRGARARSSTHPSASEGAN